MQLFNILANVSITAGCKVSGGIYVRPQMKVMLANKDLKDKMSEVEKPAWVAIKQLVQDFLGKIKGGKLECTLC